MANKAKKQKKNKNPKSVEKVKKEEREKRSFTQNILKIAGISKEELLKNIRR